MRHHLLHLEAGEGPSFETRRDLVTADQAEFGLLPAGKKNFNIRGEEEEACVHVSSF